jgi:hypothetical protein
MIYKHFTRRFEQKPVITRIITNLSWIFFVRKPHVVEGYEPFPRFLSGGEMVI